MRKILFAAITGFALVLFSCNSETETSTTATASSSDSTVNYAYKADYSSSFEMGNPKHSETILKLWKDWDNGDLGPSKANFADSVTMNLRDGSMMSGPRDSILAGAQAFRNGFSSVTSRVDAFFPVKSTDKNENWVCIWGTEISTDKSGKVDSVRLQETWRLNKEGKVDFMLQYGAVAK